jgi:hypothetical protein
MVTPFSTTCLPRTRGFTDHHAADIGHGPVSSPYAGVHRIGATANSSCRCVFPVRGGSPLERKRDALWIECLPRARGFTGLPDGPNGNALVSSPYAGVHRSSRSCGTMRRRVFPVRGGFTALISTSTRQRYCVFPVRGGSPMAYGIAKIAKKCLPRTRGSPVENTCLLNAPVCLPRTRGFTMGLLFRPRASEVSSPYAGVHRQASLGWPIDPSVFPVRGGSPEFSGLQLAIPTCLPRTRGFTELGHLHKLVERVSPPYAGGHQVLMAYTKSKRRGFPYPGAIGYKAVCSRAPKPK